MPNNFRIFCRLVFLSFLCLAAVCATGFAYKPAFSGRKLVLSVGITQYRDKPLYGCVNDATGMRDLLIERFGFDRTSAMLLTNNAATRAGILRAIEQYVDRVNSGDLFVFFYSGHGTVFPDGASAERDESQVLDMAWLRGQGLNLPDGRYDSAIVPIDANQQGGNRPWKNLILDDELYALFSQMTAKGATVILISDSCHSGSLARTLDVEGTPKFLDPETAIGAKLPGAFGIEEDGKASPRDFQGRYLALTSSADNQISIDGQYEGQQQGMFTYVLRRIIGSAGNSISYQSLFDQSRTLIDKASRGIQTPRIDTRFYRGNLNEPLFSLPAPVVVSGSARLHLTVRSRNGYPIPNSSVALFRPGVASVPAQIDQSNTVTILRTAGNGEAASGPINLRSGDYWVKAVCVGYLTFTGKVRLVNRDGVATLLIVLDPE
jgi:hypothetical protein